jgi:hypothetical protein
VRAVPVDAFDLGLVSDSNHGRARVLPGPGARADAAAGAVLGVQRFHGFSRERLTANRPTTTFHLFNYHRRELAQALAFDADHGVSELCDHSLFL